MSHDQKRASDWTRQNPVAEQLAVRDFTRPSFSQRLKGVTCETCGLLHWSTHRSRVKSGDQGYGCEHQEVSKRDYDDDHHFRPFHGADLIFHTLS